MSERHNFDLANNQVEEVNKKERFHRNYAAVSYTHLDVYKRPDIHCSKDLMTWRLRTLTLRLSGQKEIIP